MQVCTIYTKTTCVQLITEASSLGVLGVRRTPHVNSSPVCVYKFAIYLRGRAVTCMIFRNVFSQLRCICIPAVNCAGLSQHAAYVLLDCGVTAVRGEGRLQSGIVEGLLSVLSTTLPDFRIVAGSWKASRHEECNMLLSFHFVLAVFKQYSYLDSLLSPSIFLQCFQEGFKWPKIWYLLNYWINHSVSVRYAIN